MRRLNIKSTAEESPKMTDNPRKKATTLMQHLEIIIEEAESSKLSQEFLRKVKPHTDFIGKMMGLTAVQVVLFALFVEQSSDRLIQISDFTRLLGCRTIKIIALMSDIDYLESRRIVRCSKEDRTRHYRVPFAVIEAIKNNQIIDFQHKTNLNTKKLFEVIEELINERENHEIKEEGLLHELDDLMNDNPQLVFTQKIKEYNIEDYQERLLFYAICHRLINENDDKVGWHDFEDLYDEKWSSEILCNRIKEEITGLQSSKLIEFSNSDGFGDRDYFHLSSKAKEELFAEISLKTESKKISSKDLLKFADITSKQLYYNDGERQQIETLSTLLLQDNFRTVQERLVESGMRKGFACLFYGAPGTGKTETLYQIAKRTGRDIMVVDVAQIKSMWVGGSEKNITSLFDRYRALVKESEIAPILFFNEADAIIGIRQQGAERAVDKMENSIQNIILQEMETIEGIMVATTNLTQNLDKAFERRFLYKIEFTKPSAEAKQQIWQTMIPLLPENWARDLSVNYEFSGGQIENIARKETVERIIHGGELSLDTLKTYCDEELLDKKPSRRRIGY
ncbi:MAG: ATP-binding protein [Mucinivorans sp.]